MKPTCLTNLLLLTPSPFFADVLEERFVLSLMPKVERRKRKRGRGRVGGRRSWEKGGKGGEEEKHV